MSTQRIRLVVIDDHPLVHQGVEAIATLHDDLEFIGGATTPDQGLELLAQEPDVALVDLRLSGGSGLDLIEPGRRLAPHCCFLILSSMLSPVAVRQAMALDVAGVLSKDALPGEMVEAIRRVARGRPYVDPAVMDVVLGPGGAGARSGLDQLTERQRDVLAALGRGLGTLEIAEKLCVTESTVKKHISEVLGKLGLADRTQAALYAVSQGLVNLDELDFAHG